MGYLQALRMMVKAYKAARGVMPKGLDLLKMKMKARQKAIDSKKVIEFPKERITNPFKPRPRSESEAQMLARMKRQNKEAAQRLRDKKEKDLGDKLKDLPDDIDPDAMATGGRVGFSAGGIKALLKLINDKFGTDTIKTADGLKGRAPLKYTEKMAEALKDTEDFKEAQELAPKLFERMEYKVKYPGISDELLDQLVSDTDPQRKATVLATLDEAFKMMDEGMTMDDVLSTIKKTPRTKQAGGGLSYLMGM